MLLDFDLEGEFRLGPRRTPEEKVAGGDREMEINLLRESFNTASKQGTNGAVAGRLKNSSI